MSGYSSQPGGPQDYYREQEPSSALAVASLVIGILSLVLSLVVVGGLLALVGILLGAIHIAKSQSSRMMAGVGIGLSIFSILASGLVGIGYYYGYQKIMELAEEIGEIETGADPAEWVGVQAPDFTFNDLEGKPHTISELRGKRVILDFWATWCPPCVKEIPHFIELRSTLPEDEVAIIGISDEDKETIERFAKKQGVNYVIGQSEDLPSPYADVTSIPTTFFIDRNGVIQDVLVGYHDLKELGRLATQGDFKGEIKPPPSNEVKSELARTSDTLTLATQWEIPFANPAAVCTGDWNLDGKSDLLAIDGSSRLNVFDSAGRRIDQVKMPFRPNSIELGLVGPNTPGLLGYGVWGRSVEVAGRDGKVLWKYATSSGIDGAHWGDLDGDGFDEMIVGMNGGGGLHAVDESGKLLWKVALGNVWNQAVVSGGSKATARVFATEAGGTVQKFDGTGKNLGVIQPRGQYFNPVYAADIDGQGKIQIVAIGTHGNGETLIAFDESQTVAWSTPIEPDRGRSNRVVHGDINGDGMDEWAFLMKADQIVVSSASGEELISHHTVGYPDALAFLPHESGRDLLVVVAAGKITAYQAKSATESATEPK